MLVGRSGGPVIFGGRPCGRRPFASASALLFELLGPVRHHRDGAALDHSRGRLSRNRWPSGGRRRGSTSRESTGLEQTCAPLELEIAAAACTRPPSCVRRGHYRISPSRRYANAAGRRRPRKPASASCVPALTPLEGLHIKSTVAAPTGRIETPAIFRPASSVAKPSSKPYPGSCAGLPVRVSHRPHVQLRARGEHAEQDVRPSRDQSVGYLGNALL